VNDGVGGSRGDEARRRDIESASSSQRTSTGEAW
jgi:hypothetical protein